MLRGLDDFSGHRIILMFLLHPCITIMLIALDRSWTVCRTAWLSDPWSRVRHVRVSSCSRATPTTAQETSLRGQSVCSRLRHPTVKTGSLRRSVLSKTYRYYVCAVVGLVGEHVCRYSFVVEFAIAWLWVNSLRACVCMCFFVCLFLKEFHEIPFLKKFKFKRQDRVFPKEPPAAPSAAPTSSTAASASGSAASSTPSSSFPTELPTEVPAGQSLPRQGRCPPERQKKKPTKVSSLYTCYKASLY